MRLGDGAAGRDLGFASGGDCGVEVSFFLPDFMLTAVFSPDCFAFTCVAFAREPDLSLGSVVLAFKTGVSNPEAQTEAARAIGASAWP